MYIYLWATIYPGMCIALYIKYRTAAISFVIALVFVSHSYAQQITAITEYQRSFSTFKADTSFIFGLINDASEDINKGLLDSAEILLNQSLVASKRIGLNDGIGQSLMNLGLCNTNRGRFAEAAGYYNIAIPYCQKAIFHKDLTASAYNDLGLLYMDQGRLPLAIREFYMALQNFNDNHIDRPRLLTVIYVNLGSVWMKQNQFNQALFYFRMGEEVALKNNFIRALMGIYINKGGCYTDNKSIDTGRKFLLLGLALSRRINDSNAEYCALYNLAVGYQRVKDPGKALYYYHEALKYISANPYYSGIGPYIGIANAYFDLNDLTSAQNYVLRAIDSAEKYDMVNDLRTASKGAALVFEKKGDYKKAFEYLTIHADLTDSLTNIKQTFANHEYEVKYRTAEKDKDLITKRLLITRQQSQLARKNMWIGGVSAGAILLILLLTSIASNYRRRQLVQQKELHIIKQTQEITELKAAIKGEERERTRLGRELHDGVGGLFSAFTISFNSLGKENEYLKDSKTYRKTAELLHEITSEIRKTSHNLMPDILQHYSLPEAVRQFCNYMQDYKTTALQIVCQSYGHFELMDNNVTLSTYRIIQELIQNVAKHSQATYALVQLIMRGNTLNITVEDNGIGFDENKISDGMGLLNLRSRIKSINGTFTLESFPGKGTTIFIELELTSNEAISQ